MKSKTRKQILLEIICWLYVNHNGFNSAEEWRESLVHFLKSLLE